MIEAYPLKPESHSPAENEQSVGLYEESVTSIKMVAGNFNRNQLRTMINQHVLGEVMEAASEGYITTSVPAGEAGEVHQKALSEQEIIDQLILFVHKSDAYPSDKDMYRVLSRSTGLRTAIADLMGDSRLQEPLKEAILMRQAEMLFRQRTLEQVEEDLGEVAIEAVNSGHSPLITHVPDALKAPAVDPSARAASVAQEMILGSAETLTPKNEKEYLRTLLPPVVRPPEPEQPQDDNEYAHLFEADEDRYVKASIRRQHLEEQKKNDPEQRKRDYYDAYVTLENRTAAVDALERALSVQPQLVELLRRHGYEGASLAAVDAVREDPQIRYETAKALSERLDVLADEKGGDLGERVVRNSPDNIKVDPLTGARLSSRDYAVNMALKMIGGEFAERLESADDFQRSHNGTGAVIVGQHRHAARGALFVRHL